MEGNSDRKKVWIAVATLIIIVAAALIVWLVLATNHKNDNEPLRSGTNQPSDASQIDSLISYELPAGWTKVECSGALILAVASDQPKPSCSSDVQNWPVKILLSSQDLTDCRQIKVNNQQVTAHTCRSQFINDQKVINSSTTYNDKSSYNRPTKVSDYYLNIHGKTIQLEYIDNVSDSKDDFQAQFDQLVNTVKVK